MAHSDQLYLYYPVLGQFLEHPDRWTTHIGSEAERIQLSQWASPKRKGNYLYFTADDLITFTQFFQDRKITDLPWRSLSSSVNANSLGPLGYLLVSSNDSQQTCHSLVKYSDVVSPLVTFYVTEDKRFLNLEVHPSSQLPKSIADNLALMMIQFAAQFGGQMASDEWNIIALDLTYPTSPEVLTLLEKDLDSCTFNAKVNRFRIPLGTIHNPFPFGNVDAQNMAITQIQQLQLELQNGRTLTSQIKQMLMSADATFLSMEEVAETLHITPRTLQRRLATENTSYRVLINAVKIERAIHYMTKKNQPPKQAAYLVGFKDASSFTKAFKRYTGETPSGYLHKYLNQR